MTTTREQFEEALARMPNSDETGKHRDTIRSYASHLEDRIKELKAQVPMWIKMEDALPEVEVFVLVSTGDCVGMVGEACLDAAGIWRWQNEAPITGKVTHWQSLPAAPAKEGGE